MERPEVKEYAVIDFGLTTIAEQPGVLARSGSVYTGEVSAARCGITVKWRRCSREQQNDCLRCGYSRRYDCWHGRQPQQLLFMDHRDSRRGNLERCSHVVVQPSYEILECCVAETTRLLADRTWSGSIVGEPWFTTGRTVFESGFKF